MNSLFLIRVPVAMDKLARCAGERGWLRHRGNDAGFDEGRALHHLLDETFGPGALRPFRLLVATSPNRGKPLRLLRERRGELARRRSNTCSTRASERSEAGPPGRQSHACCVD